MTETTTEQKKLKKFLERRHPEYVANLAHWDFLEATYFGGREWFAKNIFRYLREGDREFEDRLARCYRFNHTRETVDLVGKYIFKSDIVRNWADASPEVRNFWENVNRGGLDIDQFMRLVATLSSVFGRIWIFVDNNKSSDIRTVRDEKAAGVGVYAYIVRPRDVLDLAYGEDGNLNWMLVRETIRDDGDPIESSGDVRERFRLWERHRWRLFEVKQDQANRRALRIELVDEGKNTFGEISAFPVDNVIGDNKYVAPALINDIAYLDRAVANYLSNLDAIIQDQTFSQLAMPAQAMSSDEEAYDKLIEMGTRRIFVYDGEGGAQPTYISPDVKQANLIVEVINKIINEIYNTIGMAGERTKQDNAVGIDNSSGVAKAYDFERMNSLLTSKADSLENAENKLIRLVLLHYSKQAPGEELVKYPDTFDVRSLYDEFTIAERLSLVDAPAGVRREQMKQVVNKLFPRLAKDLRDKLEEELKSWPPDPIEMAQEMAAATAPPSARSTESNRNPQTQNRQGQVTADTPES